MRLTLPSPVRLLSSALIALALGTGLAACQGDRTSGTDTERSEPVTLVVYSARAEHLIRPVFDRFTEETGIRVRYITDDAGPLLTRLAAEGANTRADLLMTVDAGNLWQGAETGVLRPLQSDILEAAIPAHLRDAEGRWFGLSIRARTLVYNRDRLDPEQLSTYEDLADPKWRGRLCLRTSKKVYNQSLVATMIASLGEAEAEAIVRGWVDNLAMAPFANDTQVMEAVAAGQCDVGIVNTYYYGRLMRDRPQLPLALFWPNQEGEGAAGRGVHLNVSGAGITRHAPQPEAAQRLLEWLAGPDAQQLFAELNMEYPANPSVPATGAVTAWGDFHGDELPVGEAGRLQGNAIRLMDRVGYR